MRRYVRFGMFAAFVAGLVAVSTMHPPAEAGKPGGGGAGSPIRYQLHFFSAPNGGVFHSVQAMNESGVIVGGYFPANQGIPRSGYIYDPTGNVYQSPVGSGQAVDLNELVHLPEGWAIRFAGGINDHGAIVAAIHRLSQMDESQPDYELHGIVIDTSAPRVDGKWHPLTIPDLSPLFSYGRRVNNDGDVVGVFRVDAQHWAYVFRTGLYDNLPDTIPTALPIDLLDGTGSSLNLSHPLPGMPFQVLGRRANGTPFRYTEGDPGPELYAELSEPVVSAINTFGEFCGRTRVRKSKGTQTMSRPFRWDPGQQPSPTLLGNETDHARLIGSDINNSSDVAACGFGMRFLFHATNGAVRLDDVVTGTSEEVALWLGSDFGWGEIKMTERIDLGSPTVPGYPCLAGVAPNSSAGVLLIPRLAP